jgi:3-oxoacyl-[acyl-carrier protein] reductase
MSNRKLDGRVAVVTGATKRLISAAKKAPGRNDILVNRAGAYEFSPREEITEEHFHKHFDVEVLGLLLATCPD